MEKIVFAIKAPEYVFENVSDGTLKCWHMFDLYDPAYALSDAIQNKAPNETIQACKDSLGSKLDACLGISTSTARRGPLPGDISSLGLDGHYYVVRADVDEIDVGFEVHFPSWWVADGLVELSEHLADLGFILFEVASWLPSREGPRDCVVRHLVRKGGPLHLHLKDVAFELLVKGPSA